MINKKIIILIVLAIVLISGIYISQYERENNLPPDDDFRNNNSTNNSSDNEDFNCGDPVVFDYSGETVTYGTVENPETGMCWLDRNLGASRVAMSYDDEQAYGDLFQWGRLDDGHQDRFSNTTTTLSNTDDPGHSNFIEVSFFPFFPYDWRSPQNDNLWQGESGTNNPCPDGWRIPTGTEWNNEKLSWISNDYNGAYASPLKLTAGGYRSQDNGLLHGAGSDGYYWSSTVDGAQLYITFDSWFADMYSDYRASGHSVRCIVGEESRTSEEEIKVAKENSQMKNEYVEIGKKLCEEISIPFRKSQMIKVEGDENIAFISCYRFAARSGAVYVLEQIDGKWEVTWEKKASGKSMSEPELVDVGKDGVQEIYWSRGTGGGTCTGGTYIRSIYSVVDNQEFSLSLSTQWSDGCRYLLFHPFTFSENLQEVSCPSKEWNIKKYLLEKYVEANTRPSSEMKISFPSRGALALGEIYYVILINESKELSETDIILWEGEKRLGPIYANQYDNNFFEWKAGEYITPKGDKKIASPGEDYYIRIYSETGLEESNFILVEIEEWPSSWYGENL
jgi:hypothetical protein